MNRQPLLLVRADANDDIGLGHFMRGVALAQAWSDRGGTVAFATSADAPRAAVDRARTDGFAVVAHSVANDDDGARTRDLARELGASAIVADGYTYGPQFQRVAREAAPLLVIDDNGENGSYIADFVLNQNLHAAEHLYSVRVAGTRLLLGPHYLLLRRDLAAAASGPATAAPPRVRRVVVTMGGTDPRRLTPRVIEAVRRTFVDAEVLAIIGGAGDEKTPLDAIVLRDVRDMATVLASADLAISAAGTTAWELAAVGTPMVLVVSAENQRLHADALVARGAALHGGDWTELDVDGLAARIAEAAPPSVRDGLVAAARAVVDGRGAGRVADTLLETRASPPTV